MGTTTSFISKYKIKIPYKHKATHDAILALCRKHNVLFNGTTRFKSDPNTSSFTDIYFLTDSAQLNLLYFLLKLAPATLTTTL